MSCSRHASAGHTHTTISNRPDWRDGAAAEAELTTLRGSCDAHYASLQRERERMTRAEHRIRALEMENKRLKDALTASFAAETSNKHRRAADGGDQNSSSPLGVTVTVRQYAQLLDVARRYQQTLRDLAALQKTLTRSSSSNNNNGGGGSGAIGINADARFTAFPITIPDLPPNALGVKQNDSVVRRMSSSAKPSSSCDTQRPSFKNMSPPPPPPPAAMDDSPTWGDVVSDTTMSDGDDYDWGSSDGIATSPQPHALRRSLVSPPAAPSSPPPRGDVGQQSRMLQSPLLDGDANARLIEFDDGVGSGKGLRASEQHSVAPLVVTISDTDTTRKIQEEEKEKEKEKEEEEAAWQGPMHRHSGKFAIPLPPPVARPFGSGKPTDSEVDSQIDRTDQLTLDLVRELSALSAALPESAPKRIAAVCEKRGLDYVDVSFPPVTASLGVGGCRGLDLRRQQGYVVRWHSRSAYMAALGGNPSSVQLLSSAAAVDPCALRVGQLGDRGVVAALAALAEAAGAVTSMLASTTTEDERNGVYSVWLSQHGLWTLVHVDAFLPCVEMDIRDGGCKQQQPQQLALYGCSNALAGGDLWGAVSEKALAKTCGSYRALFALHASDAVGHFTGGPVECWEWWQRRPDIAFEEIEAVINTTARGSGMVLLTTHARPIVKSKGSHQQREDGRDDEVFSALAACNLSPGTTYRALSVTVSPEGDAMLLLRNWERHGSGDSRQDNRQLAPLHAEVRNTESCLWLNYKTEVQRYFKQCHVCFDCRRYHDVRIPILFSANRPAIPQYLCRITVLPNAESEPARLWIGLHQPPPGGHHGGGGWRPEIKISLIGHDESRPSTNCVLSESYGGMYQAAMPAVWMYMELDANPDSSTMFYVLPRVRWSAASSSSAAAEDGPLEAAPRTAVLALLAEKRESVCVELLTSPAELTAALYLDVVEQLDLSLCSAAHSPTPYQTNGQQMIPEAVFAW